MDTLKVINKVTGEIIGTILTNHGFTLDEALDFLDIKVMRTQTDYENESGYNYDELALA